MSKGNGYANKTETYIAFILSEIRKGNIERGKVLAKFVKKWQTSERTFDRYFKTANERHLEAQEQVEKQKAEIDKQMQIDAHIEGVLTKIEKQKILSDIANGHTRVQEHYFDKETGLMEPYYREPTAFERLKAVEIDNKMAGDNAPAKIDATVKVEQPLFDDDSDEATD